MAQNDVEFFDQFLLDLTDADIGHDFGSGNTTVIKCAIVDSTTTPTTATADPCWGAGGTTNFSTWEASTGGTAGGETCSAPATALSGGLVEFTWGDPAAWASGTDTDAKWGIIYNDSVTKKGCIGFVDLGTAFDMNTGTLTITFGSPVATLNQSA